MNFLHVDPELGWSVKEEKDLLNDVVEVRSIFAKRFGKYGSRNGPRVGDDVKIDILANDKITNTQLDEATRLPDLFFKWALDLVPESILKILRDYYRAAGEPLPERLRVVDRTTKLSKIEIGIIKGDLLMGLVREVLQDKDKISGFFAQTTKTVYMLPLAMMPNTSPGLLAHELAHAYASEIWYKLMLAMNSRKMMDTGKLTEGMAIHVADIINTIWLLRHPNDKKGDTHGSYDNSYLGHANEFIKLVGVDSAFEAYFGGDIRWSAADKNKPEDTLHFGRKRKLLRWPWR